MVVFSLLLVNIFDTIGTVLGLVSKLGIKENEKGDILGVKEAMMSDAIGTTASALLQHRRWHLPRHPELCIDQDDGG